MPALKQEDYPTNPNPNPRKRRSSLPELWLKLHQIKTPFVNDPFSQLSDESLSLILSKVSIFHFNSLSLVCKRWCFILGQKIQSLNVFYWDFILSGRLITRFPNLIEINLLSACFNSVESSEIFLSNKFVSVDIDCDLVCNSLIGEKGILGIDLIDQGLKVLASGCPNLRKLILGNASEQGLAYVAEKCVLLHELEVHCCRDKSLRSVSWFRNLQILKLIGFVEGVYDCVVSDIGLTILAQGCRRLIKLELTGCEGSYDGIKAIGQCCHMLEELTLCGHRMDGGWLSALPYCGNLKTLRLRSCRNIDVSPGPEEYLGSCAALEELFLERCQLRDKESAKALFVVCESVREISFHDCWGLENDIFCYATICRGVQSLSLEGCSLLTIQGLDSVVHAWKDLQTLRVVSCNNIKDTEITPELATLFSILKELKWRPGSRSLLAPSLAGTGVGKKGGRFFKRMVMMMDKRK